MVSMPPATGPALIILVAFVLPGFVTVLLQERTFKSADDPTPLDRLLRIIVYSVLSYLLVAILAIIFGFDRARILRDYHHYTSEPAQLVWRWVLLVVVPSFVIALATFGWSRFKYREQVMEFVRLNPRHTEPTAWDFYFRKARRCYVRVTLTSGGRVFGLYDRASFASYSKDGRDVFLERVFAPDPDDKSWFGPEIKGHGGVWINPANVVQIEIYNEQPNGEAAKPTTPGADSPEETQDGRASSSEAGEQTPRSAAAQSQPSEEEVDDERRRAKD